MGQRTVKRRLFCIRASSLHHTRWDTHQVLPVRRAEFPFVCYRTIIICLGSSASPREYMLHTRCAAKAHMVL